MGLIATPHTGIIRPRRPPIAEAMGFGFGFGRGGRGFKKVVSSSFDPTTLGPTELCRADGSEYNGAPWVAEYGSGLNELTNPPPTGTTQNGFTPADFNGTTHLLSTGDDFSNYVAVGGLAGTIIVLFRADTAAAAAANTYDDPALVSDLINCFNFGFSDGGIGVAFFDGSSWIQDRTTCSAANWHVGVCRWNASTVEIGVDGGTFSSSAHAGALGVISSSGYNFTVGHSEINASTFFDGRVLEVWAFNVKLTNQNITDYVGYVNSRYNLSL